MVLQNFIVLEGIDGSGTSTQLDCIKNNTKGKKFLFTEEPTSSATGRFLRSMLKGDVPVSNETAAYLFAADRNEHINGPLVIDGDRHLVTGVREACSQGYKVVSDRYLFSSLAYQSISCPPEIPRLVNSKFPLPRLLIYFDIDPRVSLKRIGGRDVTEIYEKEDFLSKTVTQYKKVLDEYRAKGEGMDIVTIDASSSKEKVQNIIEEIIQKEIWRDIEKFR